jgi:hypothetical protein
MNIVIDKNGFVLYATPFAVAVGELSTTVEIPSNLTIPKFVDNSWIEGADIEKLAEIKSKKIEVLREEYSKKIDNVVSTHVQKKVISGTEIPKEILEEREALKAEYHEKLAIL